MKIKNNQSGIAHIALVLIVLVVMGLVGFVGWKVWDNNKTNISPNNDSSQTDISEPTLEQEKYINVIQKDGSVIQESPKSILENDEQIKVFEDLHANCPDSNSNYISVLDKARKADVNVKSDKKYPEYPGYLLVDGDYATTYAYICSEKIDTLPEYYPLGTIFIRKNTIGKWELDFKSQLSTGLIKCSDADGKGYPIIILPRCGDGENPNNSWDLNRAPR